MVAFLVVLLLAVSIAAFLHAPRFGALPRHDFQSLQYRKGRFHNAGVQPKADVDTRQTMRSYLSQKSNRRKPDHVLPTEKANLHALEGDAIVWLGHSSFYLQFGGKRMLADPVFSPYASPVSFINRAFKGTSIYTAEEMPEIDCLLITHDHWDHLDYPTVRALNGRCGSVICPLGVGAHFHRWGFSPEQVFELDWGDTFQAGPVCITALPAQHFSGRGLTRNPALWASFLLESHGKKIFFSGDTGYGAHFRQIGEAYGPIDLAILENGQYNPAWHYIHMLPEDTLQAARDVRARAILPAHSCKFCLSLHGWDEPLKRLSALAGEAGIPLHTPVMGSALPLFEAQFEARAKEGARWFL